MTRAVQTALAGAKGVLQVVQGTLATKIASATGDTGLDIGLTASVTPVSTTSKVKVSATTFVSNTYTNTSISITLQRMINNSGTWVDVGVGSGATGYNVSSWWNKTSMVTDPGDLWQVSLVFLDSPNTTNVVAYRIWVRGYAGTTCINRNYRDSHSTYDRNPLSTILLEEIAG